MPNKPKSKRQNKKPVATTVIVQPQNNQQPKRSKPKPKITALGQGMRSGGAAIAQMLGIPGGVGRTLGAGLSRIFGQGDYMVNTPKSNSLMASGPPAFSPLTSGVRIRHREYIADVQSSVGFASKTYSINPGLNSLFPWLSQISQNFEEYKIHGMVVYLNTTSASSVGSTNTALGLWGVVTQYDPSEPEFVTKQQCENYVGCQTSTPSQSLLHGIECKPQSNILDRMYVRSGDVGSDDIKFYDWGKIQVFSQGMQAVSTIGEMWVSYDIEFYKPRLPSGGYVSYTDRYYVTGGDQTNPFGAGTKLPYAGSNIGTTITGGNTINFPSNAPIGVYLVCVKYDASVGVSFGYPAMTAGGALAKVNYFTGNTTSDTYGPQLAQTAQRWGCIMYYVSKSTTASGTLTFAGQSFSSATVASDIVITRVSVPVSSTKPSLTKLSLEELNKVRNILTLLDEEYLSKLLGKAHKPDPASKEENIPLGGKTSYDQVD